METLRSPDFQQETNNGIFGMDLGMGARTAQECEEKLESLGGAS